LEILGFLSITIFSALRVWVISERQWLPSVMVLLFLLFPCVNITESLARIPGPSDLECMLIPAGKLPPEQLPIIGCSMAVVADVLVLFIT